MRGRLAVEPGQGGVLAGLVAGQCGPEACLERPQSEQHHYHLSHVCCADCDGLVNSATWMRNVPRGKNALVLVC